MSHKIATQRSLVGTVDDYRIDTDGDSDFRFAWDEEVFLTEEVVESVSLYERFNTQVAYGLANANNAYQKRARLAVTFRTGSSTL